MEKEERKKHRFGLIGRNISYSFSRGYFSDKFERLNLKDHSYENFDLEAIEAVEQIWTIPNIKGLNVTIPYKEAIIPYLQHMDPKAETIGAVNTIKFTSEGPKGFNTDIYGFRMSLEPHLRPFHKKALILGTGGASKAISFVLRELGIGYTLVSRNPKEGQLSYQDLTTDMYSEYLLIINCTPLGTYPKVDEKPPLDYVQLGKKHLLFDLIYNPDKTAFLREGEAEGATICNGLRMLELQAEKAWEIWND